jgi:hypothetical protein
MERSRWLDEDSLGRFRSYLRFLAEAEVDGRLRKKIDPSDIVQETLLKAVRSIDELRGGSDAQVAAWLRSILARRLSNAIRDLGRERRDYRREESLDIALERSSERLGGLCSTALTGSQTFERNQVILRVSDCAGRPARGPAQGHPAPPHRGAVPRRHGDGHGPYPGRRGGAPPARLEEQMRHSA